MRFQFRLEGLLRVRRLLERQARGRLDESLLCVRGLEHSLAEAAAWKQRTVKLRAAQKILPAAEVQFIESILRQTQEAIHQCQLQKQAEEQRAAELRTAYLDARRERKTVSTLRENALRQFQVEQLRLDQHELDEIYLGKLIHSRNASATPETASTELDSVDDRNLT
jgi:flagellar export protein FliJ